MTKMIVFDLDGVLIDSRENMKVSWQQVNKKLNFGVKFSDYFRNIGRPFEDVLKKIGIKRNINEAKKIFRIKSIKNFNLINTYPGVKYTIEKLKKKGFILAVLTSKERSRTLKLLKRFDLNFRYVQCPIPGKKGKPNPFLLNKLLGKTGKKRKNTFYIGDTYTDYKFAMNSGINFIFCKYGYGKITLKKVKKIGKIKDLLNVFSKL